MENIACGGKFHYSAAQAVDRPTHVKTGAKRCIFARKDTEDGPHGVKMPEESLWYWYYVVVMFFMTLPQVW